MDYIIRASAAGGDIRAFASVTTELTETARKAHNTSPVATAALGRLLTAAGMMGVMMKGEQDILTIKIQGDGPMEGLTVTADSKGDVKGYVYQPEVMLPPSAAGKLAGSLKAEKLMLLTDVEGLYNDMERRDVIRYLNVDDGQRLTDQGTIAGGMIPKVDCCVQAVEEGVTSVHIIDGRQPHNLLEAVCNQESTGTTVGRGRPSAGIRWS